VSDAGWAIVTMILVVAAGAILWVAWSGGHGNNGLKGEHESRLKALEDHPVLQPKTNTVVRLRDVEDELKRLLRRLGM
jgi:hypothetical protein